MTTTLLQVYNGALMILKVRRLSTTTDNRPERLAMDDEYNKCVQAMLEEGDWNFAAKSILLEASVDVEPSFGYNYAFEKPDDFVRLISLGADSTQWPPLQDFRDESAGANGAIWLANVDPIYVTYVSNDANYGLERNRWPQTFVRAVEYDLAQRIAPYITTWGADELRGLRAEAREALRNAKTKDARGQPVQYPPPGRLTLARNGSRGMSGRRPWE